MCSSDLQLGLEPQTPRNSAALGTAFTVTIDARNGISTGVSAADRARTIAVCMDKRTGPSDLVRPGHLFPLRAKDGGVLVRAGQTEGSVDLCRLAGLREGAVICEIIRDDGQVAGSVSGGCIEDDLIRRLREGDLDSALPMSTVYGETAEEVQRFGLPCEIGRAHV